MKSKSHLLISATACLGLAVSAASAWALNASTASPPPLSQAERGNQLPGKEVFSSDNQQIGKLDILVADLESGHVLYAVVSADKGKIAVPPQVFTKTTGKSLRTDATKAKLEGAPQFTSNNAQPGQMGQAAYLNQIYQYFGLQPWWAGSQGASTGTFNNVHRLDHFTGMKVENSQNQPLGKVNSAVVDLPAGHILYVVLKPDSSLNLGNNLYPMPPMALTLSSNGNNLVSGIDQQKLAGAPHFSSNQWPTLSDQNLATQVYQYYGKQPYFTGLQPTGR